MVQVHIHEPDVHTFSSPASSIHPKLLLLLLVLLLGSSPLLPLPLWFCRH
jgi:hypothetical protein